VVEATSEVIARIICYVVNAIEFLRKSKWKRAARAAFSTRLSRYLAELEKRDGTLGLEIRAASGESQSYAPNLVLDLFR
jgi:hypothetical protein